MTTLLIVIHTIVCLFLICIVLLQHGKGADIGATFGGSSQSLFGTEGPLPLLNKITTLAAIVFMGTSITLAYMSAHESSGSVMTEVKVPEQQQEQPAPAQKEPITVPMPAEKPAAAEPSKEAKEQSAAPEPAKETKEQAVAPEPAKDTKEQPTAKEKPATKDQPAAKEQPAAKAPVKKAKEAKEQPVQKTN